MGNTKPNVLIIDDDVTYLRTVDSYLKEYYNVVIFKSARMAADYLMRYTPDIILMDYQMPQYNGADLMSIMNERNPQNPIPTIVVSGALDEKAIQDFCACKPRAYLTKPITKDILLETIGRALW